MSDPERLLSTNELGADERLVLRAGVNIEPPVGAKDEVWSQLAAKLGPGGSGSPGGGSGVEGALWTKVALGLAMGLVGVGAAELAANSTGSSVKAVPTAVTPATETLGVGPPTQTTAPPAHGLDRGTVPTPVAPSPAPTVRASAPSPSLAPSEPEAAVDPVQKRKSQLEDESRMLRQARTALQSGHHASALAQLGEAQKQYPKLILAQEYEALTIDALAAAGGKPAAQARARRFLELYPNSPHAEKMRKIADNP